MSTIIFTPLLGRTITSINAAIGDEECTFIISNNEIFTLHHVQSCCEDVSLEDICGDIEDLLKSPLITAELVSSDTMNTPPVNSESYTWTFYRFATAKGSVTLRFFGESNGYYSESVSLNYIKQDDNNIYEYKVQNNEVLNTLNDQYHCENGPAIIRNDRKFYYLHGVELYDLRDKNLEGLDIKKMALLG